MELSALVSFLARIVDRYRLVQPAT